MLSHVTYIHPLSIFNSDYNSLTHDLMSYTKYIIVTGGTNGLGQEAAKVLATDPSVHVTVTGRVRHHLEHR